MLCPGAVGYAGPHAREELVRRRGQASVCKEEEEEEEEVCATLINNRETRYFLENYTFSIVLFLPMSIVYYSSVRQFELLSQSCYVKSVRNTI